MFENTAIAGLAITGAAFVALVVSLRPGLVSASAPRIRLRVAALVTTLWSGLAAWVALHPDLQAASRLLSVALCAIWVWQLEPIARWQGHGVFFRRLVTWLGPVVLVLAILATAFQWRPTLITAAGLLLCVFGILVIEQLYRNATAASRPALRWFGLGVGAVFVTEMVVFAQMLLVGIAPQTAWPLRAAAYLFAAIAIHRGARRMPDWSFGLLVSRHVVFHASSCLLIGAYLLLMTAVGRMLLQYWDDQHELALVGFMAVAIAGLAIAFFLGGIQRRLKVLIATHFYPHRYDYRAEWLRFNRTLSQPATGETLQQRSIRAVAQIVGAPAGILWCHRRGNPDYETTAAWPEQDLDRRTISADDALPAFMIRTGWLVDVAELRDTPGIYEYLELPEELGAADMLIVPLMHVEHLYGWIVLHRPESLGTLNFEDRDLLKTAGRQVAVHLSQFDADAQLLEAHQFETYNRMTAFVMHDLKNIAAQLRLISQNAERHRQNPEFVEDAFRTVATASVRMTKLIGQLTSGSDIGTMQTLDLARCAERAAMRCSGGAPVPQLQVASRATVFADLEKLTSIIEHAVKNAQDATPATGEVRLEVLEDGGRAILRVVDSGAGMDARFIRERLFRPFDTTKGSRGMGIGAFQVREYMRSLGGDVEVESEPGQGSVVSLIFAGQVRE